MFKDMIIKNKFNWLSIHGINHTRLVGIDKETGEACDFDYLNFNYYREPETGKEQIACLKKACEYYNSCDVKTDKFSVIEFLQEKEYIIADFFETCILK